ncbi:MAG: DUF4194 domain-containing protein [Salinisphaera sp.]|nr:DUF4194 domain-containing protein [Salinisphaera sp.]
MSDIEHDTLSPVLVALFRGLLFKDANPELWEGLFPLQARVRDYVSVLGLDLVLDDAEGYAYLCQQARDDDASSLPRLVSRRPLSYPVSLLLVLLRKKLAEHDSSEGDPRLILSREQIVDLLRAFLPDTTNEARLVDRIDQYINRIVELGFLRRLRGQPDALEVRRILKAFVDAQWIGEFDQRLAAYHHHAAGMEE